MADLSERAEISKTNAPVAAEGGSTTKIVQNTPRDNKLKHPVVPDPGRAESTEKPCTCGASSPKFFYDDLASAYIGVAMPYSPKKEIEQEMFKELCRAFDGRRDAYFQLNALLDRFEAVVIEKWLAMSENERFEILYRADEGMSEIRRYDLDIYFDPKLRIKSGTLKEDIYSRFFLWPMLSGALKSGTNFLRLLNSRGRNPPNSFLLQDIERFDLARDFGCLSRSLFGYRLPGWAVNPDEHRTDRVRPFRIGELDGDSPRFSSLPLGALAADIARFAYLCQTHILKTCVSSCMSILGKSESDKDAVFTLLATKSPSDRVPKIPNATPDSKKRKHVLDNPWSQLEDELLYDVPRPVDLKALLSRVKARSEEAADAFLAAREEPAAFQYAVNDAYNCCLFRIPRLSPNDKASTFRWKDWEQWVVCYQIAFQQVLYPAAIWHTVSTALERFLTTKSAMAKDIDEYYLSENEVHKLEVSHAVSMRDLMAAIDHSQEIMTTFIQGTLPGSQGFRKDHRIFSCTGDEIYTIVQHGDAWKKDPFLQCISHLSADPGSEAAQMSGCWEETMDRMQPLLQIAKNKQRLTDSLVFAFDDMLLLSEIKRSMKTQQPEYFRMKIYQFTQRFADTPRAPPIVSSAHLKQLEGLVAKFEKIDINTAKLNHSKDAYSDKASRNNRERLGRAENELEQIWHYFEEEVIMLLHLQAREQNSHDIEDLQVERQLGWEFWVPKSGLRKSGLHADTIEAGESAARPTPANPVPAKAVPLCPGAAEKSIVVELPFRSSQHDTPAKRPELTSPKDKVKTRPAESPKSDDHSPKPAVSSNGPSTKEKEEEEDRTIHLSRGALKTALSLFGHESGIPAELPWVDMARLMSEMGFEGVKNGGSAWHFKPIAAEALRIFKGVDAHVSMHEPHPEKSLVRRQISGIVRRLKRRLVLEEDMFVLVQRDTKTTTAAPMTKGIVAKGLGCQLRGGKKGKGKRK